METDLYVIQADWQQYKAQLSEVRRKVFIEEQHVPANQELDIYDATSLHILGQTSSGQPVGTGRLKTDGQIGRMAVISSFRNMGLGTEILRQLLNLAKQAALPSVYLHAQSRARNFYLRNGFTIIGDEFMEAGITHLLMNKKLE